VATGHYAITREGGLYRGRDRDKDQTYFLWGLDRRAFDRILMPVGTLTKDETRAAARRLGLATADKPGSVEICFVPHGDYTTVLEEHLGPDDPALASGPIRKTDGTIVGEHNGYARYTVGQRRGLPGGSAEPLFVLAIDPDDQAVIVGTADELLGHRVVLRGVNWLVDPLPSGEDCEVQVRYRARPVAARVSAVADEGGAVELQLAEPVRAITPGQSGVLYAGDRVLGGGNISRE
jgi:tRNA-specific 2-thiouridylase